MSVFRAYRQFLSRGSAMPAASTFALNRVLLLYCLMLYNEDLSPETIDWTAFMGPTELMTIERTVVELPSGYTGMFSL